jgi:hypothetical protein
MAKCDRYKVHIGFTVTGRNRWRKFATLEGASMFCGRIWRESGIVLSIIHGK